MECSKCPAEKYCTEVKSEGMICCFGEWDGGLDCSSSCEVREICRLDYQAEKSVAILEEA